MLVRDPKRRLKAHEVLCEFTILVPFYFWFLVGIGERIQKVVNGKCIIRFHLLQSAADDWVVIEWQLNSYIVNTKLSFLFWIV